jgi:hypothetical protein
MKNRYGAKLRRFVSRNYHLRHYVDMVGTPAFNTEVVAYPAITVIARESAGATRTARRPDISAETLSALRDRLLGPRDQLGDDVMEVQGVVRDQEPWLLEASASLALARRLEAEYPLIEDAGCLVGIGVATGADSAFIAPHDTLDVEPDRKLPLVTTKDIRNGRVEWRGLGVVNPFRDDGSLVDLAKYPRLRAYLMHHQAQIRGRNVAVKNPANWYRTIDRIYPKRTWQPKLLIPDIKGSAHIVYESGKFYSHHNLYYITSDAWNMHALAAVLQSGIAHLFVSIYSTVMHGGFLRFQAQYLRRIRLPRWRDVPDSLQQELMDAAQHGDRGAQQAAVAKLYRLRPGELAAIVHEAKSVSA